MRAEVWAEDLKSVIERVSVVTRGKSSFPFASSILIETDSEKKTINVSADNVTSSVCISMTGSDVAESGEVILDRVAVKRLFNLSGKITIYNQENNFCGKNAQKMVKIPRIMSAKQEYWPESMTFDNKKRLLTADKNEFMNTMENMIPFTAFNESRPIYNCVNINAIQRRMSAVSGYHVLTRESMYTDKKWDYADDGEANVPAATFKELKKIADSRTDSLTISTLGKLILFEGNDFRYIICGEEGTFMDVSKAIPSFAKCQFILDVKELEKIVKEYADCIKSSVNEVPMTIMRIDDKLYSNLKTLEYETCDRISGDVGTLPDDFIKAYNPLYLKDVVEFFKKAGESRMYAEDDGNQSCPTMFSYEDYRCMILPVRLHYGHAEHVQKAISEMFAA